MSLVRSLRLSINYSQTLYCVFLPGTSWDPWFFLFSFLGLIFSNYLSIFFLQLLSQFGFKYLLDFIRFWHNRIKMLLKLKYRSFTTFFFYYPPLAWILSVSPHISLSHLSPLSYSESSWALFSLGFPLWI